MCPRLQSKPAGQKAMTLLHVWFVVLCRRLEIIPSIGYVIIDKRLTRLSVLYDTMYCSVAEIDESMKNQRLELAKTSPKDTSVPQIGYG